MGGNKKMVHDPFVSCIINMTIILICINYA